MAAQLRPARLCLEDGTVFEGALFGAPLDASSAVTGEVVFTTGMTGYQEVLSDPSYSGQIVTMTAPQIGNTGVNTSDPESNGEPLAAGFIVRELSSVASNWRSEGALESWLAKSGLVGLTGIDTRRLTRHLRDRGSQNGAIGVCDAATLVDRARSAPKMEGLDLVGRVTCKAPYTFTAPTPAEFRSLGEPGPELAGAGSPHVVAMDLGIKRNILHSLVDVGCRVSVVPATTSAEQILAMNPDGIFVSNGPGDPAAVTYAIDTLRGLLGKKPIFGICLGHQLLALASGGRTYKLKFGHRGLNQPVQNLDTGRIEITSQNHGFVVDVPSLPKGARSTYVHLNDGTSEGLELPDADAFSVQFHPEAAAGPHDTLHLFARFRERMVASA
ncbi:MAG: glutamine-hydrolyzing carbamoyl-phosphate synthase small subunit [Polyangiaceae bacterium]|nr:glutamine-hydrolyzing carbamoyl-phosphate synthase small subunit [Polyangiaceae bacterium]